MSAHCHSHSTPAPEITPEQWNAIDSIIESYRNVPGNLMPVLQAVQEEIGCLPPAVQDRIATGLNIPGSDVFGVMSFYSMYTWRPKGKYVIRFCESPPCHIQGADNLLEFTQAELGVPLKHTTKDGLFTLETTACLGVCEVAPAMQINEVVHGNLTKDKIRQILADYRAGKAPDYKKLPYSTNAFRSYKQAPGELILLENVGVIDPEKIDDYLAKGGYQALKQALTGMTPEKIVEEVKASGLRGRGGAGFPTGLKWSFTRPLDVPQKYIICNLDEGEPGTIKDRYIVEGDPHKLLEGMAIAGFAVGADKGYIYCRGEYYLCKHRLATAIAQARAKGYLGENLFGRGFSFDIEVRSGFGCYICGEETALIESIEGKRGYPRSKPPFPGVAGLWQKPTIVNNVETLAAIPAIITRGGEWYKSLGTADTTGTKIYQIIGHVRTPQIVEVPAGITLRELIDTYGGGMRDGGKFKMCQTGGASAGIVGPEALDVPVDFGMAKVGGALGSGTMLVMDESVCAVDFARSVAVFFAHESCGQCTPCREGTRQLLQTLTRIWEGKGQPGDLDFLERLGKTMMDASFCPLGQTAPAPLFSLLKRFRQEFEDHIAGKCTHGVCKM
ncbi:NADH-quinone oxidoreductase subunit NuoF [Desulfobacca acetoxidans]|uniref:NADH dehydrogenase (Quinone) n=1 Tax=Desulfobacca acetoxidans (strain ATCC 700848 / DSM 11109 / ASRB2) TaxID=880072 RepID=F2NH94_DESAR|nr:NADH-quinone oxidoreductase subunit NuoF [Desulfobacca acetoxidans]AEB08936.1 NADH dehydrogenase (quinone) [Desulfobacca acetoxidans DSM 11109]